MIREKVNNVNEINFRLFFFFFFAFLGIAYFIISQTLPKYESYSRINLQKVQISLLNILISAVFISISLSTKRIQMNMAFLWIFQFVFFGLTGLLTQLDPFPYYLSSIPDSSDLLTATWLVFIAQLCIGCAQLFTLSRLYFPVKNVEMKFSPLILNLIWFRVKMILLIYFVTVPLLLNQLGGLSFLVRKVRIVEGSQNVSIAINAILQTTLYVPPILCLICLIFLRNTLEINKYVILTLLCWVVLLSNPLANSRQVTLFLVLPLLFIFISSHRKLGYLFFLLLPLVFVYSAGLVDRYTGRIQAPQLSVLSRNGDFDSFSQLANGVAKTHEGFFPILHQIFASLFFYVPRSIWPSKPNDTGLELGNLLGLRFQNLSAPWLLEAYVNGRIFGVIFLSIILGFLLTRLDLNVKDNFKYFVISSLTSGFLFIILRGSLLQATGRTVCAILLALFIFKGIRHGLKP